MLTFATLGFVLFSAPARATNCDTYVRQAANHTGDRLVRTFSSLAQCDSDIATAHYEETFLQHTGNTLPTLVGLTMAAIENDVWVPVWGQLSLIVRASSYETRDEIARQVGEACLDEPKVVTFLQGAYIGIRSTIDFQHWSEAYTYCESEALTAWMDSEVEDPPDSFFDERYDALLSIYTERQGAEALEHLSTAALAASQGEGPFESILLQMDAAVQPSFGSQMSAADEETYANTLYELATRVGDTHGRMIASQLANAGMVDTAIRLLPTIYSDRVQEDGGFLYGTVAVETAQCGEDQKAVLHFAAIEEPGTRWFIEPEVEETILSSRARLTRNCVPLDESWTLITTSEPINSRRALSEWADELVEQWAGRGYQARLQNERDIELP